MKKFASHSALFIGLILISYPHLALKISFLPQFTFKLHHWSTDAAAWKVKPGSIYDGDTLRVVRGEEELKIRFCGIDAPERDQELGIESRDYLRSLVSLGNGELLLVPIEKDRYERTVAEVYVQDRKDSAIPLNLQMVRDGYAWHYERYSGNCPSGQQFAIAQELAQSERLGIWQQGNPQPPWDYRKSKKAKK